MNRHQRTVSFVAAHQHDQAANAPHDTRALQAWLGHRNIQHTLRYTELASDRFKGPAHPRRGAADSGYWPGRCLQAPPVRNGRTWLTRGPRRTEPIPSGPD